MRQLTFCRVESKLKRNPKSEDFISPLDVEEERPNPDHVAFDQHIRIVEGDGTPIEKCSARRAEIDEVKITFDLTNACM